MLKPTGTFLAIIMLAAIVITIMSWPSSYLARDDSPIVVVSGSTKPALINATVSRKNQPILSGDQPGPTVDPYRTGFTNDETAEIDKLDEDVRQEARDESWAASAEKNITDSISRLSSVQTKHSTVLCGSASCFFSIRVPGELSQSDKQGVLEAVETANIADSTKGSLLTSRMFSQRQDDGSLIIRALIIRS